MAQVGEIIIAFSCDGRFPSAEECEVEILPANIGPAIASLKEARKSLEAQIHSINDETKDSVGSWVRNVQTLQEDVLRSKTMANAIMKDSEDPGETGRAVEEAEEKARFLTLEVQYAQQLHSILRSIKHVNKLLNVVEEKKKLKQMTEALRLLDESTQAIKQIPVNWLCRPKRLLEVRAQELKEAIHEALGLEWSNLVTADIDNNQLTVRQSIEGEQLTFQDAIHGLKYFKEVDEYMDQLYHNLDAAILAPRMEVDQQNFTAIQIRDDTISLSGEADNNVASLLSDLGKVFTYLHQSLPSDVLNVICSKFVPDLISKLIDTWLIPAIPPSVKQISEFDEIIHHTRVFCKILSTNEINGFDVLVEWVSNAPQTWLTKCRDTTLDNMRIRLAQGTKFLRSVERIHKEIIQPEPEPEDQPNPQTEDPDNWDLGWIEDNTAAKNAEHLDGVDGDDAWGWDDDATNSKQKEEPKVDDDDVADAWGWNENTSNDKAAEEPKIKGTDDVTDAWGWGDDEATQPELVKPVPKPTKVKKHTAKKLPAIKQSRLQPKPIEIITKEKCTVSSIPDAVLESVVSILEDGVQVTRLTNDNIITPAASGIFAIPTLILALFRGISPYYYALEPSGNMYLYNDAMYLAESLSNYIWKWTSRKDMPPNIKSMLHLEKEVRNLQTFANRTYGNELNMQKTVVRDLMGGAYNFVQQGDYKLSVETAVERVQSVAVEWGPILGQNFWCKSVGALIETMTSKVIADIMDLPFIGQEEGYEMARMITRISELDKLFLPSRLGGLPLQADEITTIASHVSSWLRMQFLSEVLQSNLNDIKFMWFESDLSLYFTVEEVVDLIGLSFDMNARAKEIIREIGQNPVPRR